MPRTIRESFSGFGRELLERFRDDYYARLDEVAFEERIIGLEKATAALCEAGVDKDTIIQLLQKHWDLRRSEANEVIYQTERLLLK